MIAILLVILVIGLAAWNAGTVIAGWALIAFSWRCAARPGRTTCPIVDHATFAHSGCDLVNGDHRTMVPGWFKLAGTVTGLILIGVGIAGDIWLIARVVHWITATS